MCDFYIVYYRIYAEDGAIASKTPATPDDPFLGRIKAISVPPPHTAKALKFSIARVENIKDRTNTSLFLSPYSQSAMSDSEKVALLSRSGLGSTPQEPLALVAKMPDSERSKLESEGRAELASVAESDTTASEIRYRKSIQHSPTFIFVLTSRLSGIVYYLLYADDYEMPSKVAFDPEKPSLGRIRADSISPPHSPSSIKRCISRVERAPAIIHADIFAAMLCDTPLKEDHISFLRSDGPGLSPFEPMAIVQMPTVQEELQVEKPLAIVTTQAMAIPDGKYVIKNRAADIYWYWSVHIKAVYFLSTTIETAMDSGNAQVNRHSPFINMKFSKDNFLFLKSPNGASLTIPMVTSP